MITPRTTRLLRAPDLRALQRTLAGAIPAGAGARRVAVLVPTRSAAAELRRTLEAARLTEPDTALVLPDLLTRHELYLRLHRHLPEAPRLLTGFEREVLLRLAARDAVSAGHAPPFRVRPGLIAAVLAFYDELRRRGRTIDSFDRHVRGALEAERDTDRGAARLFDQTAFLSSAFAAFEHRVGASGAIDEHALRTILLSEAASSPYRHVVVAIADAAADPRGLWPADLDLLARLPGLERIDVVATERTLAAGLHQRLHDALPGIEEVAAGLPSAPPRLQAPAQDPAQPARVHIVCRDREEELVEAVRWIKQRARTSPAGGAPPLERTAVVFQRPLPYLYLARQVFASARVPYQAADALPLAAEPFAAALDLVLLVAVEDAARTALVDLLGSPHWAFHAAGDPARPIGRRHVAALDRVLRDAKYLGGWDRLAALRDSAESRAAAGRREGARWRAAAPALSAAAGLAAGLEALRAAPRASGQIDGLLAFIAAHERLPRPEDAWYARHMRARGAVLGALAGLRDAHARHDDEPLPIAELVAALRRWIEGQTFAPRTGSQGVVLVDAPAAAFVDADAIRLVGLVEPDWPERAAASIFYPASLLRDLGWHPEAARLAAARARFEDLLFLPRDHVSISTFTLEEDAIVAPSPLLEEVAAAGLAVERTAPAAPARVFTHEALAGDPVVRAAVSGIAGDWLDLRLARTAPAHGRYHGSIGGRAAETYAVSRVERYLECPFRYFAGHVLQLEEEQPDESGLTPRERGQLLHGVFEAFFTAWSGRGHGAITAGTLGEAIALFESVAEEQLHGLPEADRALERSYLLGSAAAPGLAERAFAFEIEQGTAVVERLLEHTFDGTFRFEGEAGARDVRVRGKADRIDLLADGTVRLVDYKLGRAPKAARALQLPVYAVCAVQDLEGRHGRGWSLGTAGYVAFRERNPFVEMGGRDKETALRDGQRRFVAAIDHIEAGEFPVSPDEPWTCTRCGFPHLCRKDYVGDV